MPGKIFISHDHRDKNLAVALAEAFSSAMEVEAKDNCFVSSRPDWGVPLGEQVVPSVERAIASSSVMVVLLTRNSVTRPWIYFEAGLCRASGKKTIVLRFPGYEMDLVPEFFRTLHHIDLSVLDNDIIGSFFDQIAKEVNNSGALKVMRRAFVTEFPKVFSGFKNKRQVCNVCFRRCNGVLEVLLIRNRINNSMEPGNKWHFPKEDSEGGSGQSDQAIARLVALYEANIESKVLGSIGDYKHWKTGELGPFHITAFFSEWVADDFINYPQSIGRNPGWYSEDVALEKVCENRPNEQVAQFYRILELAFRKYEDYKNGVLGSI